MKILQLVCIGSPETGGMATVAQQAERLLRAHGVEMETRTLTHQAWWRVGHAGMLRRLVRDISRFDAVHLHLPFFGADVQVLLATMLNPDVKLIVTMHMDADVSGWRAPVLWLDRELVQPMLLMRANAILVASRSYAMTASYANEVENAFEIPFAVDTHVMTPEGSRLSVIEKTTETFVVGFVGAMDRAHHFKGVDVLLRAIAMCPDSVIAVLSGDGELRSSYEALAQSLGISHRVHFLGRVSDAELPSFYRSCDVCCFPSISRAEAFGLVAVSALACGVPVIASDLPGVRDVVTPEVGVRVPAHNVRALVDAIEELRAHPEQRAQLANKARAKAEREYTEDVFASRMLQVYQTICASPS